MNLKIFIVVVFIFCYLENIYCQEPKKTNIDENIEMQLDESIEMSNDIVYPDFIEQLEYYSKHPLNLNTANAEQLKHLEFLNDLQINNLIEYRNKFGKFYTIYELQAIDGFYLEVIYKILPYIYVSENIMLPSMKIKDIIRYGNNKLISRYQQILEKQKGYIKDDTTNQSKYLGSPARLYNRYDFNYCNIIRAGIIAEKDAGEEFFKGSQKNGFDFYSAFLSYNNTKGIIRNITVGNFNAAFGQGLTLNTGIAFYSNNMNSMNIRKFNDYIKPKTSTDENNFLRGIGTSIQLGKFNLSLLFSDKKIDGNVVTNDTNGLNTSSLLISGYHRTYSELKDKHSLKEIIYGSHLAYNINHLNLGLTAYNLKYDKPLQPKEHPYNQFAFKNNENMGLGVDYSYSFYKFNYFGEASRSSNNAYAFINGAILSPDRNISLSILHRYYQRNFYPILSNAFAENSDNSNENGIYTGISITPFNSITISAYSDYYKFQWLKYDVNAPSTGRAYSIKIDFYKGQNIKIYLYYKFKSKELNTDNANTYIPYLIRNNINNYRFNIEYNITDNIKLRNRLEIISDENTENKTRWGYMIYQDIIYKINNSKFSLITRYTLFDTETYNERIYVYENDLPNTFSVPALYDKGTRIFLLVHYKFIKNGEIYLKCGRSFYPNRNSIGSAYDQIDANHKTEVKTEIILKF